MLLPDERIDTLGTDELRIIQSSSVFAYSTDALLLANFARVPKSYKMTIMDLCSGTGAVALLVSQKTNATIIGVDIQQRLVDMATRSIALNKLDQQVTMLCADVGSLASTKPQESVDCITCNPPYFKVGDAPINPNPHLAIARHELYLDIKTLVCTAAHLLKRNGTFFIVHRPDRFLEILALLQEYHLVPKRIQFVYPKSGRDATVLLIESIKYGRFEGLKIEEPVYLQECTYGET